MLWTYDLKKMVAEAEMVVQQSIPVLDHVQYRSCSCGKTSSSCSNLQEASSPTCEPICSPKPVSTDLARSQTDTRSPEKTLKSAVLHFVPCLRSGSFSDIGRRRYMEDEHIRIDDLSKQLGPCFGFPKPSAFYGVFDGHGGPEAAAYVRKNVLRLLFEDAKFPQASIVDDAFLVDVEDSLRKAFLSADLALADDCSVSSSSGTTALTAIILGRLLMVANAGDCRAVLCRKGEAIDMSQDHRPSYVSERRRVEELGGYVDDGYLNGVLSVTRALGDWDLKLPRGSASPLIADPEFRQVDLTEDDEFLIIGCDGIWDVMSSQQAVSLVRRGLRRHDDPEQCAKDLVMEALRLHTLDNLTVIVVCFTSIDHAEPSPSRQRRLRCCSLTVEQAAALSSLRSLLDGNGSH